MGCISAVMFQAAKNGDADSVRRLLAAGADVNDTGELLSTSNSTALMAASLQGHVAVVRILVHAG